jgi:hypothetical protein
VFGRLYGTFTYWADTSFWIGRRTKVTLRRGGRKERMGFGVGKGLPGQREELRLGVGGRVDKEVM